MDQMGIHWKIKQARVVKDTESLIETKQSVLNLIKTWTSHQAQIKLFHLLELRARTQMGKTHHSYSWNYQ